MSWCRALDADAKTEFSAKLAEPLTAGEPHHLYANCRYLQKVSKFSVPRPLQSVTSEVSLVQSVGAKLKRHN